MTERKKGRKCEECLYLGTKPECFPPSTDPEFCMNYVFVSSIHGEDKKECPICGHELEEIASPEEEYECSHCGITFVVKGNELKEVDNQTAKADKGKPKLTLVPRQIIYDICEVREYGNAKYPEGGPDNWKKVDKQRYRDAAFRHFLAYLDDPHGVDEESGIKHLKHLACNIAFLCEIENYAENYMTFYANGGDPYMTMKVGGEDGENS